jgi:hypothetical protein
MSVIFRTNSHIMESLICINRTELCHACISYIYICKTEDYIISYNVISKIILVVINFNGFFSVLNIMLSKIIFVIYMNFNGFFPHLSIYPIKLSKLIFIMDFFPPVLHKFHLQY